MEADFKGSTAQPISNSRSRLTALVDSDRAIDLWNEYCLKICILQLEYSQ